MRRVKEVSSAEKLFVTEGVASGIRSDGRHNHQFRQIDIENSILPHANGSSRVSIGTNGTSVVCSIRADITEPSIKLKSIGKADVQVDFSPSCSSGLDEKTQNDLSVYVAHILQSVLIDSSSINLSELCIIEGKYCWHLHIDLMILQLDGDPTDACSLAIHSALHNTKLPKISLLVGESGKHDDFEVSGDLADAAILPVNNVPICITAFKIGSQFVMDCSMEEVSCASSGVTVAVDKEANCCGIHKLLGGIVSVEDILAVFDVAVSMSPSFMTSLDKLSSESANSRFPDKPAVRLGLLA